MAKIFSAVKRAQETEDQPLEFFLPGTEDDTLNPEWLEWHEGKEDERGEEPQPQYIAGPFYIKPPTTEQMVLIVASGSDLSEETEQTATFINVFYEMLDASSARAVRRLLLDRRRPVDLDVIMQVVTWAMEQVSDRPTEPQRALSSSPKNAGRASTGRARRKG